MNSKRLMLFVLVAIAGLISVPQAASALEFEPSPGGPIQIGAPNDEINGLATADLDGNGNDDFISTGNGKGIYVFLADNNGQGFTPAAGSPFGTGSPTTNGRANVYAGQFGGDSAIDLLVVTRTFPQSYETYIGNGDGTFPTSPNFSLAIPNFVESVGATQSSPLEDVNDDGWPDLIVGMKEHSFRVALGSSTGQFSWTPESPVNVPTATNSTDEYFFAATVGDWNGNGTQDIALAGYDAVTNQQNAVYVANGNGSGTFIPAGGAVYTQGIAQYIEALAKVDLNGDDYDDIALSSPNTAQVVTLLGSATGVVPNPAAQGVLETEQGSRPGALTVADFSGSGPDDVGVSLWGTTDFGIGVNTGVGNIPASAGSPFPFPDISGSVFRANQLVSGDFNGDGAPDIGGASSNYDPEAGVFRGIQAMINRPVPVVTPTELDFPVTDPGEDSDPLTLTLENQGGADLFINSIVNPGDTFDEFTIDSSDCPATLSAGDECEVEVTFSPSAYGTPSSNLLFSFIGGVEGITVPLTGHTPAAASVSPAGGLDFGEVISGYAPGTKTLNITYSSVGGEDLVLGTPEIGSFDAADFQIVDPTACADPIPSGSSCVISVKFAPPGSVGGFREASFDFATTNDPDPPNPLPLGGDAVKAEYSVTPGSFDFGDARIGTDIARTEKVFTLNSTGSGDVAFSGATITGPDADSFHIIGGQTCPPTIDAYDGTCTITVEFDPGSGSVGARNATLNVDAFSSVVPGPATVALSGTATGTPPPEPPEIRLRLKSAGKVKRGKTLVVTATVVNLGRDVVKSTTLKTTVPKRFAKAPKAIKLTNLVPDKPVTRKLKIKVKKTAKKGKKLKVKVTATAGSTKKTATRTVRVR